MVDFTEGTFYWVHIKGQMPDVVYVTEKSQQGQKYYAIENCEVFEEFMFPQDFKDKFNPIRVDRESVIGKLAIETFEFHYFKNAGIQKA